MIPIFKNLPILLATSLCLLIHGFSFSQTEDSLAVTQNADFVSFQKVTLDGKTFYQNKQTKEYISPLGYAILCELDSINKQAEAICSDDHWVTDKVNPYRDVTLPVPFKIAFDQDTFTHPVDGKIVITSRFGRRRRGSHRGLDIDLVTGDTVKSVLPGKVRFVGYSRGHGMTVIVRHANDVETLYAHLSGYIVKVNDTVSEGEALGLGGNTGNSRGSHLHLEVRYKGICIHPEYVFNFNGSKTVQSQELWVTRMWKTPSWHSSYRQSKLTPLRTEEEAIAAKKAEPIYHRVRGGDTLSEIAEAYHVGLSQICRLNSISVKSTLRIGQTLQVR